MTEMADTDAHERKKLKPTYRPGPAAATAATTSPLPPGWTEHTAPTGHKYYYNSQTKQSTYTRPVAAPSATQSPAPPFSAASVPSFTPNPASQDYAALAQSFQPAHHGYPQPYQQFQPVPNSNRIPPHQYQRRPQPEDRPKKKAVIPACAPWILIYTKLGRRFVHNTETKESLWKFPPDVMSTVIDFDRLELEKKLANKDEGTGANNVPVGENTRNRRRSSASLQREDEAAMAAALQADNDDEEGRVMPTRAESKTPASGEAQEDDSSEYEEVEVTDDEDDEDQDREQREIAQDADADAPVEFGEDDIAYQLAQMGQDYGLDPGEYDDAGYNDDAYEEGAEGLPLTFEDSAALFRDMLDDHSINPFTPWDKLIEDGHIIQDERYTILPTTKDRKEVWDSWSRDKIAAIKSAREKMEKEDPFIPYLRLLDEKATPKLYWPEFKRKFKKEPCMLRDQPPKFTDKQREKLYREHISRLKLPERSLKNDLISLLKNLPLSVLNRDTTLDNLPRTLLSDVRFISLAPKIRLPLVEAHVSTLAPAPVTAAGDDDEMSSEQAAEKEKLKRERERREAAMKEREKKVQEDKIKREREMRVGMARLRDNERELEDAMRIGKRGLVAQLDGDQEDIVDGQKKTESD